MNYIVTTTINPPTPALKAFAAMPNWRLVVVGDLKTPHHTYEGLNCDYLSPKLQEEMWPRLSGMLGWNIIQRRNIGFLWAYKNGARVVASVDDDNIPMPGWGDQLMLDKPVTVPQFSTSVGVDDPIYIATRGTDWRWHRGFPIPRVKDRECVQLNPAVIIPDIQADFWNGDPDIDAKARKTMPEVMLFNPDNFPFTCKYMSPFNSQNTFVTRNALRYFFMIPGIGRMDDIWASYYAQAQGCRVVYGGPSVIQERNNHNIDADYEAEMIGYTHTNSLIEALKDRPNRIREFIPEFAYDAMMLYQELMS